MLKPAEWSAGVIAAAAGNMRLRVAASARCGASVSGGRKQPGTDRGGINAHLIHVFREEHQEIFGVQILVRKELGLVLNPPPPPPVRQPVCPG